MIPDGMVPPSQKRPNSYRGGIIQICVTRACDKACFGCTQGSNLGGKPHTMTPDQFEQAVLSLRGYWGVIGVFGGNPCTSKYFEDYCRILQRNVAKVQCGLWSNKLFGKGPICRDTFNPRFCNLNVHMDREAYEEFRRDWPEARPFGLDKDSRHSPPFVAMLDLDELPAPDGGSMPNTYENRLKLIGGCDINRNWSAIITLVRGELRAYFCEIAGAQAVLHENDPDWPDVGLPVTPGWWEAPMAAYAQQVEWHCHRCGIPLKGYGELAIGGQREQVSATHANIYKPKRRDRDVQLVELRTDLLSSSREVTDYMGKGQ